MKTSIKLYLALVVILTMTACKNDHVTIVTTVNEDGSCARMITLSADSASLCGELSSVEDPLRIDGEGWEKTWALKGSKDEHSWPMTVQEYQQLKEKLQSSQSDEKIGDTIEIRLHRRFGKIDEMSNGIPVLIGDKPLQSEASLESKFRWFFTDYEYTERFKGYGHLFPVPLENYLSNDEAAYWFTGQPDIMRGYSGSERKDSLDRLEEKVMQWTIANNVYIRCDVIASHYDAISNPPVSKQEFIASRDSLIAYAIDKGFNLDNNMKLYAEFFYTTAFDVLNNDSSFQKDADKAFKEIAALIALRTDYSLIMPGKVLEIGNGLFDGEAIAYRLTSGRLIPGDYVITASSRTSNLWAWIITIICLIACESFLIWHAFLRKKNGRGVKSKKK